MEDYRALVEQSMDSLDLWASEEQQGTSAKTDLFARVSGRSILGSPYAPSCIENRPHTGGGGSSVPGRGPYPLSVVAPAFLVWFTYS
jgi:hypothetical protein